MQRAHVAALREAAILNDAERLAVLAALDDVERSFIAQDCPESSAEDLHTWIEGAVIERAGDAGRKLHTGRSRNDQIATLLKLYVIQSSSQIEAALREWVLTTTEKAIRWADVTAPMQTHAQFAAPGTMGFWILRYAVSAERIMRLFSTARDQWEEHCPLGSAAVAGTSIPIDRDIQAASLGFRRPSLNALDSTSTRDECLQLLAILTQLSLHYQSFAADLLGFSQTPFGWVAYPAAFASGSSMMPNKVNPDAMELLRGRCCSVQAAYVQLLLILKGLPSGYNRDLQCCKPIVHAAVQETLTLTGLLTAFLADLEWNEQALLAALSQGRMAATLEMERKVLQGMPMRIAHHEVAASVDQCGNEAQPNDVRKYRSAGSAHPDETRRIANEIRRRLLATDA